MKWFVLTGLLALSACSPDSLPAAVRRLDRPVDVAFGCTSAIPSAAGEARTIALPLSACSGAEGVVLPQVPTADGSGTQPVESPAPLAFVLQSSRGEVVFSSDLAGLDDADRLSPGFNGTEVGSLPVAIETSADGCVAVTANAGSCDLTTIDIEMARNEAKGGIRTLPITRAGMPLGARPAAMVTPPPFDSSILSECSVDTPPPAGERWAYVAFPGCNVIARVDLGSGAVLDAVQMLPGQAPTIVGPDGFTCEDECNVGKLPADLDAGAPADPLGREPVTLTMDPSGDRLYVGSEGKGELLIIGIGPNGAPTGTASVQLEGAGGIRRMAATGPVAMGQSGAGGIHSFVYAAAEDGAIHVVDVTDTPVECDTQIDRRFLHGNFGYGSFACFPVGDPENEPRRPGARGPGIRLPGDVPALDLAVWTLNPEPDKNEFGTVVPGAFNGVFVFASANTSVPSGARGVLYVINVDDDNYPDFEDAIDPRDLSDVAFALPHTLRDNTSGRGPGDADCSQATISSIVSGPPRLSGEPERTSGARVNFESTPNDVIFPMVALAQCPDIPLASFALGLTAPYEARQTAYPDVLQLPQTATYTVSWEGPLAADVTISRRGGGLVSVNGPTMALRDDAGLLCDLGTEVSDIVQLLGCKTDADCNPGDTCYAHPEAPTGIDGMCLPEADVVDLSSLCRDVLVAQRRYTIVEARDDGLTFVPRPKQLESTPIEGCESAQECTTLENAELTRREQNAGVQVGSVPRHTWTCAADATVGPGNRCLMTCEDSTDCSGGSVCSGGRCVLGPIPPAACMESLQRYEIRAGDAFSLVSTRVVNRHRQIRNVNGVCETDLTASPLLVTRFGKNEPLCTDLASETVLEPNPCRYEGTQPIISNLAVVGTRDSTLTRLRLPELTVDVADTAVAIPSIEGKTYSPLLDGYFFRFQTTAGFLPMARVLNAALPVRVKITPWNVIVIVDGGDNPDIPSLKGQLILMNGTASEVERSLN